MNTDLKVGQTLFIHFPGIKELPEIQESKITKIDDEYFYVDNPIHQQFHINFNINFMLINFPTTLMYAKAYKTKQEILDLKEIQELHEKCTNILNHCTFDIEVYQEIYNILNEKRFKI